MSESRPIPAVLPAHVLLLTVAALGAVLLAREAAAVVDAAHSAAGSVSWSAADRRLVLGALALDVTLGIGLALTWGADVLLSCVRLASGRPWLRVVGRIALGGLPLLVLLLGHWALVPGAADAARDALALVR